jgi:hypothetical protein
MGIANIINTSTSSGGGGGEIIRELVNSSDGQGLYFSNTGYIHLANNAAAEFGTSDFSIEFILNQTGEVGSSGGSIYQSATTTNNKFSIENHVSSNVVKLIFFNAVGSATQYDLSYNMAADYNEPTHYVVSCDRSGNAVLYRNGTEVASVSIATSASINLGDGVSSTAMIGNSGSGYTFLGGLYRFRTWNKALTHDEVDTCFQRADVPFIDQYGSETDLVNANSSGSGTAWTGASGTTAPTGWSPAGSSRTYTIDAGTGDPAPSLKIEAGSANVGIKWGSAATLGKKHRVTFSYKCGDAATTMAYRLNDADSFVNLANSTSWATKTVEWTGDGVTGGFMLRVNESGKFGHVDTVSIRAIGCLTDHDLAFANPTQSLMVQDRAGVADGTASASGVSQTQPIVQLNSTSARIGTTAATPADGEVIANVLKAASDSSHATIEVDAGSNTSNSDANFNLSGTRKGIIRYDHNASDASGKFQIFSGGNTSTARVSIDGSGNVYVASGKFGVGNAATSTPSHLLTVQDSGASGLAKFYSTTGTVTNGQAIVEVRADDTSDPAAYDLLRLQQNTTEKFVVDGSGKVEIAGNVSINHSSPNTQLDIKSTPLTVGASGLTKDNCRQLGLLITPAGTGSNTNGDIYSGLALGDGFAGMYGYDDGSGSATGLGLFTGNGTTVAERLKISATGLASFAAGVSIDGTGAADAAAKITHAGASRPGIRIYNSDTGTSAQNAVSLKRNNVEVGTITTTNSATAYNTSSDYRLKENLTPLTGALDRIEQLPVYRFNFKADPEKTVDGFVAHEAATVVPESIHGEKDGMQTVVLQEAIEAQPATYWEEDDELPEGVEVGDEKTPAIEAQEEVTEEQPDYQGIDQSKLVPLLVAAVKELKTEIDALKNA